MATITAPIYSVIISNVACEVFKTETGSLGGWRLPLRAKMARWAVNPIYIAGEEKRSTPFLSHSIDSK